MFLNVFFAITVKAWRFISFKKLKLYLSIVLKFTHGLSLQSLTPTTHLKKSTYTYSEQKIWGKNCNVNDECVVLGLSSKNSLTSLGFTAPYLLHFSNDIIGFQFLRCLEVKKGLVLR